VPWPGLAWLLPSRSARAWRGVNGTRSVPTTSIVDHTPLQFRGWCRGRRSRRVDLGRWVPLRGYDRRMLVPPHREIGLVS